MNEPSSLKTEFEWAIYADATFAGLSILIPIPGLDWAFEHYFRTRMPRAIARHRGQALQPEVIKALNQRPSQGWLKGCLTLAVQAIIWLIKRISRKILYFLTVKEATDMVSYYWHQAFLFDMMLAKNQLAQEETALLARQAMDDVLQTVTISPLLQLAQQITGGTRHIFRTLRRARRGHEDAEIEAARSEMKQTWTDFAEYFALLAEQYDRAYEIAATTTEEANAGKVEAKSTGDGKEIG